MVKNTLRKMASNCLGCGQAFRPMYSSRGLFCSNKCQQDHAFAKRYAEWLAGKEESSTKWLRRALHEKDGPGCSVCFHAEWCGKPLVLELDHIDGDWSNNSIKNLRLICPNCHSQTDTYKNRNKGKGRPYRRMEAA